VQQSGLEHRSRQFLDQERNAFAPTDDRFRDLGRQRLAAGQPRDQRRTVPAPEAADRQKRGVGQPGPGRLEVRAGGDESQYRHVPQPVDAPVRQFQCRGVDPMNIFQ
jgi:hypothetical protein